MRLQLARTAERMGQGVLRHAEEAGRISLFTVQVVARLYAAPAYLREIIRQMYAIGVQSVGLVGTVVLATGLVLAMQTVGVLARFGAKDFVAVVVGLSIVRELGPVLTALMVAGRAGSGISAEIGAMRVTRQIDALTVSAVDPLKYLVVTRVVACVLVMPLLTAVAIVLGLLGGFVIAVVQEGISPQFYIAKTLEFMGFSDYVPGMLKAVVFGFIISVVACFHGFYATGGTEGVGRATTTTVLATSLLIMMSDVVLTRVLILVFGFG